MSVSNWIKLSPHQHIFAKLDDDLNFVAVYPENTSWFYTIVRVGVKPKQVGPFYSLEEAKASAEETINGYNLKMEVD